MPWTDAVAVSELAADTRANALGAPLKLAQTEVLPDVEAEALSRALLVLRGLSEGDLLVSAVRELELVKEGTTDTVAEDVLQAVTRRELVALADVLAVKVAEALGLTDGEPVALASRVRLCELDVLPEPRPLALELCELAPEVLADGLEESELEA